MLLLAIALSGLLVPLVRGRLPAVHAGAWSGVGAELHVVTQMRQGTRESNAWNEITPGPLRAYFRERYMADLQRTRPRIFVDATGPGSPGTQYRRRGFEYETVPELRVEIARAYRLAAEVDGVRIFVRRD